MGVTGYDAEAFAGTNPQGNKPANGTYTVNKTFSYFIKCTIFILWRKYKIVFNSNHAKLIDLETEGIVNGNLDNRVTEGL